MIVRDVERVLRDRAEKVRVYTTKSGKKRTVWKARYSPHDLRHTWASWLYSETPDIRALMDLGGWKSEKMVMRYTHLNADHLADAIERLPWENSVKSKKGVA